MYSKAHRFQKAVWNIRKRAQRAPAFLWYLLSLITSVTESENHTGEVDRYLWRSRSPILLLKWCKLQQIAQDGSSLDSPHRWRCHNFTGKSVTVLGLAHSRSVFFWCSSGISCVLFSSYCLLTCNWRPLRRAWLCPPSSLSLSFYQRCSMQSITHLLVLCWTLSGVSMFLLYWRAKK